MKRVMNVALACSVLAFPLLFSTPVVAQWTRTGTDVYVTNTGDEVGVGTTAPSSKFHIYSSETFPTLKLQSTQSALGSPRLMFMAGAQGAADEWQPAFIQTVETGTYRGALDFYTNGNGSRYGFLQVMRMVDGRVGIGVDPIAKLHVADGSVLFNGTTGTTPTSGAGTRMMYVPAKIGAFRVGAVLGSNWDDANIGNASFAAGHDTKASGYGSVALGVSTTASGDRSFAAGHLSSATGIRAIAIGEGLEAQSLHSFVCGTNNVIAGSPSVWNLTDPLFVVGNGITGNPRSNALTVLKNGNTHIGGANPAGYMLNVNGNSYFNGTGTWSGGALWSDARLKTNVMSVTGAVEKVMNLHGVTFDYRKADFPDRNFPEGTQLGFIAQEVEKVVPEVVVTNNDGYKAVAYQNLTALLTEAIKEQQGTITQLRSENSELKARLQAIESRLGISSTGTATSGAGDLK